MLAVTLVILVWTLFPVYYMVLLSLTPTNDLFQPALYIDNSTLRSYIYTMGQDNPFVRYFWQQLPTSLTVSLWTMAPVAGIRARVRRRLRHLSRRHPVRRCLKLSRR